MKRILILIVLGMAIFEPQPVEVKPVLISQAEKYELTGAYYQKVTMPDGSRLELKSRTPLTKAQWQKLADDMWKNRPEEKEHEICPHCGQLYYP